MFLLSEKPIYLKWLPSPSLSHSLILSTIELLEALFETPLIGHQVSDVLRTLLDEELSVSEDCLHLAISTPELKPSEGLPVMVFIYGGGFKAGTQLKMGFERLGDVNDVVLVAVNYRVGPLGKWEEVVYVE